MKSGQTTGSTGNVDRKLFQKAANIHDLCNEVDTLRFQKLKIYQFYSNKSAFSVYDFFGSRFFQVMTTMYRAVYFG